jgi:hypothetical protein
LLLSIALSSAQLGVMIAAVCRETHASAQVLKYGTLLFGEKDHVGTHHLFPLRRLPNMSSSVKKYIGLEVHKEAIAIAVLNDAGKW